MGLLERTGSWTVDGFERDSLVFWVEAAASVWWWRTRGYEDEAKAKVVRKISAMSLKETILGSCRSGVKKNWVSA